MSTALISLSDHAACDTQASAVAQGPISRQGQSHGDDQTNTALPGLDPPAANPRSMPNTTPPQVPNFRNDQLHGDTQSLSVVAEPTSPPTMDTPIPKLATSAGILTSSSGQRIADTQASNVAAGSNPPDGQSGCDTQSLPAVRGPILRDPLLALMADAVDDLERVRIASENRYRSLTRDEADSDGEVRGLGLSDALPEVARQRTVVDGIAALEHQAILNMNRQVRKHPLWLRYAKEQKGIGEKQFARLLAVIGDPYWNDLHDRPRRESELIAYCGYHVITSDSSHPRRDTQTLSAVGVAPKRAKGQKSNWNEDARKRVWVITGSCLKAQGQMAQTYYQAREKYADATHPADCVRCGPAGKPALAGSDLSDGHKHARALRKVAKTILKGLWLTARDIHQEEV